MRKILFVTSETHPFIKTGGLADVAGSLPKALAELSQDIKIIMPRGADITACKHNIDLKSIYGTAKLENN